MFQTYVASVLCRFCIMSFPSLVNLNKSEVMSNFCEVRLTCQSEFKEK